MSACVGTIRQINFAERHCRWQTVGDKTASDNQACDESLSFLKLQ